MRSKMFLPRLCLYICFSLIVSLGEFQFPAVASAEDAPNAELKIKKMAMMLAIVSKEYELAVKDGQVINEVEYEESQAFLEMVKEKFFSISDQFKKPADADKIKNQLAELKSGIQQKLEVKKMQILSSSIQNGILDEFGIKIKKTPKKAISLKAGEDTYKTNCLHCHGMSGQADGPTAADLDPKPAVLADPQITGNANSTPYDNFEVINVGIANTAMIAWADVLSEEEIWNVAYYIRTFSNKDVQLPKIKTALSESEIKGSIHETVAKIRKLIKESLDNFGASNKEGAADSAFDAYLVYETLEAALIAKQKDLGLRLQANFGRLRGEIKRDAPKPELDILSEKISADLDLATKVFTKQEGGKGIFIQSFSIIVREGFETILILSALITFLVKSRNEKKVKIIYLGAFLGIVASFLTAYIIHEIFNISSANQEIMEGAIMLLAAAMLFYISYWLISKIGAEKFQKFVSGKLQEAVKTGSVATLATLAFLSVYREGFETVLFYEALYTYSGDATGNILPGFLVGCVFLFGVFYLINKMGAKIPINWFFGFTSIFLYFMSFVFTGKGLHALQVGGGIPLTAIDFVPEIHWMGIYPTLETSIGQGIILAALAFGALLTLKALKGKES
jgi:high-affinity iron transporter